MGVPGFFGFFMGFQQGSDGFSEIFMDNLEGFQGSFTCLQRGLKAIQGVLGINSLERF